MASLNRLKNGQWCLMFRTLDKKQRKITAPKVLTETEMKGYKLLIEELLEYQKLDMEPSPKFIRRLENLSPFWKQAFQRTELLDRTDVVTVSALWASFRSKSRGRKDSTLLTYENAEKRFLTYFPDDTEINSITIEEGENYREWLESENLSEAQIAKLISKTRTVFSWAVERGYANQNIFLKVYRGSYENPSREFYINPESYEKLLKACHSQEWRVFFALMRIGALRFAEALRMKWEDIDFQEQVMRVHSPKTEHHTGKGYRSVPLFCGLRGELDALRKLAGKKEVFLLPELVDQSSQLLRKKALRILDRAGLPRWQKLFHNLRGSRSNELFRLLNPFEASRIIGQSIKTADKYYIHQNIDGLIEIPLAVAWENPKTPESVTSR